MECKKCAGYSVGMGCDFVRIIDHEIGQGRKDNVGGLIEKGQAALDSGQCEEEEVLKAKLEEARGFIKS